MISQTVHASEHPNDSYRKINKQLVRKIQARNKKIK